jgi:hypothetical protein
MPLLNTADKVYLGTTPVDAMYLGTEKVWPSFAPTQLSGLAFWLDAADYTPGVWPNRAAGGQQPGFVGTPNPVVSPVLKNGLPVVRFTVSEGRLRIQSGLGVDQDYTLTYLARIWGTTNGRILNAVYPPNNLLFGWWTSYEEVFYGNGFGSPDTRRPFTTNWQMIGGDSATGSDVKRMYANGVHVTDVTSSPPVNWGGTLAISGYDPTTSAETCDCEIAEVLLYNRKLPDTERVQVEDYLREKWGL